MDAMGKSRGEKHLCMFIASLIPRIIAIQFVRTTK